jgi:quercetin dioxygenase-like cupin family protein
MRLKGRVEKGWGYEEIFATNDLYCGKLLHFDSGKQFSMHFHVEKHETWYVLKGKFILEWIDTENASIVSQPLNEGDVWINEPLKPHRLTCVEEGTIIEVSTPDSVEDNYRILPGDSQK